MKKVIFFIIVILPSIVFSQLESDSWAISFGGSDYDGIGAIATDPNGDIAVGGKFTDSFTIGDTTISGVSGFNCFIAMFDSLSSLKFVFVIPEVEHIFDIKYDDENKIYVIGVKAYKDEKYSAMFFNKYDEQGQLLIARNLSGTYIECKNIIIDSENNIYLFGRSNEGLTYGNTTYNFENYHSFFLKVDQNLDVVYFNTFYLEGYFPEKICINTNDDIFITMDSYDSGQELGIFKLNKETEIIWEKWVQPVSNPGLIGVSNTSIVADENSLLVCGNLDVSVNFHNDTIIEPMYYTDTFIARYDLAGNLLWIKNDNTLGWNGIVNSMIITDENIFIAAGSFQDQAIIGDSVYNVCPLGCNQDIFIAGFNITGSLLWFKQGGGTGDPCDYSRQIVQDAYGNIYNAGGFGGTGYFGSDTLTSNPFGFDCYLLKFNQEDNWVMTSILESNIFENFEIEIYPNPATNEIFISSKNGSTINEVNIYNQIGQKVLHNPQNTNKVDLSCLQHGMYIIELVINKLKFREKLIIR